ncbi:MAG TPA: GNAT family N-acetyltransferase [Bryobacteraceae bacterium]|nr:GNAT family N-acetyltransferase [Bryobacteraceae bacterium]
MTTSPHVAIRQACEADVPLLLSFIRRLAEYEKLAHEVRATEEVLRDSIFGNRRVAEAVFAYAGDAPAGFAVFFHNFSTFTGRPGIYLEDLFVDPEYRGLGIGKALLGHVESVARERGCSRLQWAVLKWNQSAIDFYEKLGARPLDDWTIYRLGLDSVRTPINAD